MIITEPGIYDLTAAEYHADPCPEPSLSSSFARTMLSRTPLHAAVGHPRIARQPIQENKEAFDLGNAAHALLLHDERTFAICDEDDWRTKKARELREEAYASDRIPILARQLEQTRLMVEVCRDQLAEHECAEAFDPAYGDTEQSLFWREPCGSWCRARLDWMPRERRNGMIFYDYKTTAALAAPERYQRLAFELGLDVQDGFYARAVWRTLGVADARCRFVVQENKPPYCIVVLEMAPEVRELARRQVERAIEIWRRCLATGHWPGYPQRVCYIEPPTWHEERILERQARDPIDTEAAAAAIELQRPMETAR